jgi:hypothetical protein
MTRAEVLEVTPRETALRHCGCCGHPEVGGWLGPSATGVELCQTCYHDGPLIPCCQARWAEVRFEHQRANAGRGAE